MTSTIVELSNLSLDQLKELQVAVEAEIAVRLNVGLEAGDPVRHKQYGWVGEIIRKSTSGKTIKVRYQYKSRWSGIHTQESSVPLRNLEKMPPGTPLVVWDQGR